MEVVTHTLGRLCSPLGTTTSRAIRSTTLGSGCQRRSGWAHRRMASTPGGSSGGGTGIVLLNMGGPATADVADVRAFLTALFMDRELLRLPAQPWSGPALAAARAPRVAALYQSIGGGSPIHHWTRGQAAALQAALEADPALADGRPYRAVVAFRYVRPSASEAVEALLASGVQRAVAFPLYPQYSCTTTGSSLTALWSAVAGAGPRAAHLRWSVLDRWYGEPRLHAAVADHIASALEGVPADVRAATPVLFSAHSLPTAVVRRGDPYVWEVAASVAGVMEQLRQRGVRQPHMLTWQSAVGPASRWQGPQTADVLARLAARHAVVVPIAFTQDHIETLREIDIDFRELAARHGVTLHRAASLNCSAGGVAALAGAVRTHLLAREAATERYWLQCHHCVQPHLCRRVLQPAYDLPPHAPQLRHQHQHHPHPHPHAHHPHHSHQHQPHASQQHQEPSAAAAPPTPSAGSR